MNFIRLFCIRFLLSSTMCLFAGFLQSNVHSQVIDTPETKVIPKLTVRGYATLKKPTDQLQITLGVVTESHDATRALEENSRKAQDIIQAFKSVGLKEEEFETGRFQIRPRYSTRPRQTEPGWQPQIIGYEVRHNLVINTLKINLAGELIEVANKSGANSIDSIRFDLSDKRKYRAEAISIATANALTDARTLAESAGVRLLRPLSIDLEDGHPNIPPYAMAIAPEAGISPPITSGQITVTASVSIVYEITQQK